MTWKLSEAMTYKKLYGILLLLASLLANQAAFAAKPAPPKDNKLVEIGQRIYREGLLPSGQPLRAVVQGDLGLSGVQAACIKCHRRSGLGTIEGGSSVLPVTGTSLYQPGPAGLWQRFGFKTQSSDIFRPAYTDATLGKAIREGVTPTQRALRAPMPKYALGNEDMKALIAYLKTLSNAPSPGVDETTMHVATVIAPDADPAERKAMLDVIEAYLKDKNSETRGETRRRQTSKEVMFTSYRKLDLSVWELQGAPETWEAQLVEKYRQRPVFALVSGLAGNHWEPVHAFCEHTEVACLFPNTDVPVIQPDDFFTVYFSRGLSLEAEVLAKHLAAQAPSGPIVQVFRDTPKGAIAAEQFRQALQAAGQTAPKERKLGSDEKLDAKFWIELVKTEHPGALVLWLRSDDLAGAEAAGLDKVNTYLSASLVRDQVPQSLKALPNIHLVATWDTAEARQPRVARAQVWLQSRKVPFTHEILQVDTFWTLLTVTDATKHLAGNFSPAYLIERIEDMTESVGVLSIYPHLSLGPGQRFAAKSARVWKFSADGTLMPASEWINP
ncbi:MAG: c-type cytochrome [Methyloglobulus sp.]|nr:c-type cytochrome [Methyloglobulus sp.]